MPPLAGSFYASNFAIINVEIVGPKVGAELRTQAVVVTLYALGGMLVYIAFRFEVGVHGAATVLAVFHDVLIAAGLFSIFHFEISLTVIAALALVGYSMNDTWCDFRPYP